MSSSLDSDPISKLCVNCCSTQSLDSCDDFEDSDHCSGIEHIRLLEANSLSPNFLLLGFVALATRQLNDGGSGIGPKDGLGELVLDARDANVGGEGCEREGGLEGGGDGREDDAIIWSNFYKLVVTVIKNLYTYAHSGSLKEHVVLTLHTSCQKAIGCPPHLPPHAAAWEDQRA